MSYKIPDSFEQALGHFKKLPGVGARTAMRNILQMLKWKDGDLSEFSAALKK